MRCESSVYLSVFMMNLYKIRMGKDELHCKSASTVYFRFKWQRVGGAWSTVDQAPVQRSMRAKRSKGGVDSVIPISQSVIDGLKGMSFLRSLNIPIHTSDTPIIAQCVAHV